MDEERRGLSQIRVTLCFSSSLFLFSSSSTIRETLSFMSSCQLRPLVPSSSLVPSSLLKGNSDFCVRTCSERQMQNRGVEMCASVRAPRCRNEPCVFVLCACVCVFVSPAEKPPELRSTSHYRVLLRLLLHFISIPPTSTLAPVMPPKCALKCFLNDFFLGIRSLSGVAFSLHQPLCFLNQQLSLRSWTLSR